FKLNSNFILLQSFFEYDNLVYTRYNRKLTTHGMKKLYLLLTFYLSITGIYFSNAQTCPGSPFITYPGGDSSWSSSHAQGWCYDNLVAGQTYCFSFTMSDTLEVDINISGCSSCPKTMYTKLAGNSTVVRDTNTCSFSSGTNCVGYTPCAG